MKKERKDKHFIKKPIYEGGPNALKQFISKNLSYPKEALQERIEGTVVIRYTINIQGKVVDTKIINGLTDGCNEEADRLVRLLKFKVPKNRGFKGFFHKDLHIHFKLPKTATSTIQYTLSPTEKKEKQEVIPTKKESGYTITVNW